MPSLSPVLLRPLLFSAAIGMPLLGHAAGRDAGVQAGISDEEALRSGLAAYSPGSATSPSLQIAVSTPPGTQWRATGVVASQWFGDAVKNSPMARRGTQTSAFVSLMRSF